MCMHNIIYTACNHRPKIHMSIYNAVLDNNELVSPSFEMTNPPAVTMLYNPVNFTVKFNIEHIL